MGAWENQIRVDLYDLVAAWSDALGLVGGKIVHHGQRVAFMALHLARDLGLPADDYTDLYVAALLHHAGVSRTATHTYLSQTDWELSLIHI